MYFLLFSQNEDEHSENEEETYDDNDDNELDSGNREDQDAADLSDKSLKETINSDELSDSSENIEDNVPFFGFPDITSR